jgi:hypothetical protein
VGDVSIHYGTPLSNNQIGSWEQSHLITLPDDLKWFYKTHDGAKLSWQYVFNNNPITVGNVEINALNELSVIGHTSPLHPLIQDVFTDEGWQPTANGCCFVCLSYCPSCGHIGLAYEDGQFKGIYLIDLSLSCHYLCQTFLDYLRLAQVHLALIQWPYAITNIGLTSDYEVWYEIFAPLRLSLDYSRDCDDTVSDNRLDSQQNMTLTTPNFMKFSKSTKSLKN